MIHVTNSKNIATIDFEPSSGNDDNGVLTTTFRNGRTYAYDGVPTGVFEALTAEAARTDEDASVGKVFNKLVKSGGYPFSEIT